jgi:LPXTG-motif cell wall-anchored protein
MTSRIRKITTGAVVTTGAIMATAGTAAAGTGYNPSGDLPATGSSSTNGILLAAGAAVAAGTVLLGAVRRSQSRA